MEIGGAKVGVAPKPLRVGFLSSSLAILLRSQVTNIYLHRD